MKKDFKTRDLLIFGKEIDWLKDSIGGIQRFDNMSLDTAKKLVEFRFLEKDERQNSSPTTEEIMEFMEDNLKFTTHGYAVSPLRDDYRVTLEGVHLQGKYTKKELRDFVNTFKDADDFIVSEEELYAWYD